MIASMGCEPPAGTERLESWLRACGARLGPFTVRNNSYGGRGVYASQRLGAGDRVMEIPARCILTALGSESLTILLATVRKSTSSFWSPFLATLPTSFPSMPYNFDPAELALLKGTRTMKIVEHQRRSFAEEYEFLRWDAAGESPLTFDEYVLSRMTVLSRGFSLRLRGGQVRAIVPMVDMLDHRIPPEAGWGFDDSSGCFQVRANQEIAADAEVHITYGPNWNSRLLVNYGFALADNDLNEAEVRIPAIRAARSVESLLNTVSRSTGEEPGCFAISADLKSAEPLFSFLRIALAGPGEQARLTGPPAGPLGAQNESRVLTMLRQVCVDALNGFDGTPEDDDTLLAGGELSSNQRHAVIVRRGEKRVLCGYVEFADSVLPLLRLQRPQLARLAAAPPGSLMRFAGYLRTLESLAG